MVEKYHDEFEYRHKVHGIPHPKDWASILPDLKRRDDKPGEFKGDPTNGGLEYDGASLSWANESPYTIKNVSFTAPDLTEQVMQKAVQGTPQMKSALDHQENGTHYQTDGIQPITFITSNNLSFVIGNAIKYLFRADKKGGAGDLYKAIHYIRIELETKYGVRSEVKYQE